MESKLSPQQPLSSSFTLSIFLTNLHHPVIQAEQIHFLSTYLKHYESLDQAGSPCGFSAYLRPLSTDKSILSIKIFPLSHPSDFYYDSWFTSGMISSRGEVFEVTLEKHFDHSILNGADFASSSYPDDKIISLLTETERIARKGSWELNMETQSLFWSKEVYQIHEIPNNKLLSLEETMGFFREDYRPFMREVIHDAIQAKAGWDKECIIVTSTGRETWVRVIGEVVLENNKVTGLRGLFQDIDEEKRLRLEVVSHSQNLESSMISLRESEERLHSLINQAPVAVAMFDNDLRYIAVSNQWLEDYRIEENIIGRHHYDVFPEILNMPHWIDVHQRALAGESCRSEENRFEREDGSVHWMTYNITPWYESPGKIGGIIMHTTDVTNQVLYFQKISTLNNELEKQVVLRTTELEHQKVVLERQAQELKQFAFVASHDLQEPLRVITSYLQILLEDCEGQLDENGQLYITKTVKAAKRMRNLINGLLAYARIGKEEPIRKSVSIDDVMTEVLEDLEISIQAAQATVTSDPLPEMRGDPTQLKQLLQNIIGNALKYRKPEKTTEVRITVTENPESFILAISDNGIGIASQYKDRVFEIFQRLHSRSAYSGTGIGLAICKRIVDEHNGRIWLESEEGVGSTFFVAFPNNFVHPHSNSAK